jgi:hypothetical protein
MPHLVRFDEEYTLKTTSISKVLRPPFPSCLINPNKLGFFQNCPAVFSSPREKVSDLHRQTALKL